MNNRRPAQTYSNSLKRKNKFFLWTMIALLIFTPRMHAQGNTSPSVNDAQLWENIDLSKNLTRSLGLRFSHEGRFTNNDSRLTYYFEDIGMEYKTYFHHISIMADYVFIRKLTSKSFAQEYWDTRHQYYVALTWSKKLGRFKLHDRQMIMGQVKDVHSSVDGKIPDYYLRNKLSVKYKFNYYWSVYVAEELYWHMITPQPDALPHINRVRYFVGGYYKANEKNEFELYYLFEQHMHIVKPNHNFILGVGYSYSFG